MLFVDRGENQKRKDYFYNISDAIEAATEGEQIIISPGVYYERLEIKKKGIRLIGEDPLTTVITHDFSAFELLEDGMRRGTFRSYTMLIDACEVELLNLTVENSAGDGRKVGQAVALYAEGDGLHFKNCRFLGHQDTVFTGPLPEVEYMHGGFVGPKEFSARINGRQWYESCYIEGDVDFIFGSASALFSDCTICSLGRNMEINGYVTAPSTPKGQTYGYVFKNCDFVSKACADESVYLSRPWREYAKCIFINCNYGKHIKKEGIHDWGKSEAHETSYYSEYPLRAGRALWMHGETDRDFWSGFDISNMTIE